MASRRASRTGAAVRALILSRGENFIVLFFLIVSNGRRLTRLDGLHEMRLFPMTPRLLEKFRSQ